MFTGIVEEVGSVLQMPPRGKAGKIRINASTVLEGTKLGDSICVNGVCLTVVELGPASFCADVMPSTLEASGLGELHVGDPVDLERAMAADGRFGGHIVSGHIDGTGRVGEIRRDQNSVRIRIATTAEICRFIVERGSIAIDGISLTVISVEAKTFSVSIIPHTYEETVLGARHVGDTVNLENDIIGKYVAKLMQGGQVEQEPERKQSGITEEFLREYGW